MKYEIKYELGERVYAVSVGDGYVSIIHGVIVALTKGYSDGVFSHTYHVENHPNSIKYMDGDENIFRLQDDAIERANELLKQMLSI